MLDDGSHHNTRGFLRVLGPLMILVGGGFLAVGLISFFSAFGSGGMPQQFWCAFVGMPLLGIGLAVTKFAYMGKITRYIANEVAPVGKDSVNYMARGTKGAVRDIAEAVSGGIAAGAAGAGAATASGAANSVACPSCRKSNDSDARFCDNCGTPLSMTCRDCGEVNDRDARFCDSCGSALAS